MPPWRGTFKDKSLWLILDSCPVVKKALCGYQPQERVGLSMGSRHMKDSFYWQAPESSVNTPRQALRSETLMIAGIVTSSLTLFTMVFIVFNLPCLEPFLTWPG